MIPQIRAHLGLGLGCPIVGDHKYSHAAEMGPPQKLPGAALTRLGIRQAQVRGQTRKGFHLFYRVSRVRPKPISAEIFCRISNQIFCRNRIVSNWHYRISTILQPIILQFAEY